MDVSLHVQVFKSKVQIVISLKKHTGNIINDDNEPTLIIVHGTTFYIFIGIFLM